MSAFFLLFSFSRHCIVAFDFDYEDDSDGDDD
jgi:hypothetical protein